MIDAVALGPDDTVFSVKRESGLSRIVANTPERATALYETKDKIAALWVSSTGTIHAVGKRYYTNRGGTWMASKLPHSCFSIWGTSDDDLYIGSVDGAMSRLHAGTWTELANGGGLVIAIDGFGPEVFFVGYFDFIGVFDGATFQKRALPKKGDYPQGIHCSSKTHRWLCASKTLYELDGTTIKPSAIFDGYDEAYGVGVGSNGVFVHAGVELRRREGDRFVVERGNEDKALMVKKATFATHITSNDRWVVAAGARSVLVNRGDGFVEWPAIAAQPAGTSKKASAAKRKR